MRARVVVFPIMGRNWCFSRSIDPAALQEPSSAPQQLRDLFRNITSTRRSVPENADTVVDFLSDKDCCLMNRAWVSLEKAPEGTLKSKLHSLGLWILSRVKPSEVFLKSVSKDLTEVEIAYPASLNPRLVRRRLRHIAMRGSAIHKKHLYGSFLKIQELNPNFSRSRKNTAPLSACYQPTASKPSFQYPITDCPALLREIFHCCSTTKKDPKVLPLPNVPFFWILFRAYSHWKAFKGSEKLLLLVSDCSTTWSSISNNEKGNGCKDESDLGVRVAPKSPWVLKPSEDLETLLAEWKSGNGVRSCTINSICETYSLDKNHVLKFRDSL